MALTLRTARQRAAYTPPTRLWMSAMRFAILVALVALANHATMAFASVTAVTVTAVTPSTNSVKVDFNPVAGAADYRIYDVTDPKTVKYAGTIHATIPFSSTFPLTEIEWNGLTPGVAASLVVEAVGSLGPVPQCSLYDVNNSPLFNLHDATCVLGMSGCDTADGYVSYNGQGSWRNSPNVIARSAPFQVMAAGQTAIPSSADASQLLFDSFTGAVGISQSGTPDTKNGNAEWAITSSNPWKMIVKSADVAHTLPMADHNHIMDILFDGGTPHNGTPLHIAHGVAAFTPQQSLDFSGGRVAHLTMEVDATTDGRRWIAFNLAPAKDPLQNWYTFSSPINATNTAFFVQMTDSEYKVDLFHGRPGNTAPIDIPITGGLGQAPHWTPRHMGPSGGIGRGLDNRSRFDLFLSKTHFQLFEDGIICCDFDIPGGLPFEQAQVYFTHYLYHSQLEQQELRRYAPWSTYWIDDFPYSDQRHWNNMGFEVLPSGTSWSSMVQYVGLFTSGGSGGGSTSTTVGTVSGVSASAGSPIYITIAPKGSGTPVVLLTADNLIAASGASAYVTHARVTVTYDRKGGDAVAAGRILSIN